MLSNPKLKALLRGVNLLLLSISSLLLVSAAAPLPQAPSAQPEPLPPSLQEANTSLTVEGRLVPRQYVSLASSSSGQVTELFVQEGDWVEAGTVLLRLGDQEQLNADLAAAELKLLSARLALDDLYENAGLELALAQKSLAEAEKSFAFADSKAGTLRRGTPQSRIDQAYANMLLAENALERNMDDQALWQQKSKNGNNILHLFINSRQFKLLLTGLDKKIAYAEGRYIDAVQKYNNLLESIDPVDLAMAESDLAFAQASVAELEREIEGLRNGPDPDELAVAEARLKAAEVTFAAIETALVEREIRAPIAGKVVDLNIKAGEWAEADQPIIQLADIFQWIVETDDLTENDVPNIYSGQPVLVTPDALPGLELSGQVESISDLFVEKRGDVTYTVRIKLNETDPRLRWGMSVIVTFEE